MTRLGGHCGGRACIVGPVAAQKGVRHGLFEQDVIAGGHGGGDFGLVAAFLRAARGEAEPDLPTARESLESHLLAFAAEEARKRRQVITLDRFRREAQANLLRATGTT